MTSIIPTLVTDRLRLREVNPDILQYIFEHFSREQLLNFWGITSSDELESIRFRYQEKYLANGYWSFKKWLIIEKETGIVIGDGGFHSWSLPHGMAELGYHLKEERHRNKGYMSEAVAEMLCFGFEEMKLGRIEAFVSPDNKPSLSLMEKFGFKREGYLNKRFLVDGVLTDLVAFALLRPDYETQQPKELPDPLRSIVEGFEKHSLPAHKWTHEAHLTTGLWYVYHEGYCVALCKIRSGIISYNLAMGGINDIESGYHETITLFWIWVLNNYVQHFGAGKTFEQLAEDFVNSPYAAKDYPFLFYSKALLLSGEARSHWVEPDLKQLDFTTIL